MGNRLLYVLFMVACQLVGNCLAMSVEETTKYQKKEYINGSTFIYRYTIDTHQSVQEWLVDGSLVSQAEYLDAIGEAEKVASRLARSAEHEQVQHQQQVRQHQRQAVLRRMLELVVQQWQELQTTMASYQLEQYLSFNQDTLSRATFDHLLKEVLPDAKKILTLSEHEYVLADVQEVLDELEAAVPEVRNLVDAALQVAIKQCSDTQLLKKLLTCIEGESVRI